MDDILQRIKELQDFHDEQLKLNKDILKMFELAGREMHTEPVDGKSRPKEILELLQEVLDNPPEEPQRWIRIQDIPRFIDDYLIYPDKQLIESWNEKPPHRSTVTQHHSDQYGDYDEPDVPEEPEGTVNDKGELDPELEYTNQEWQKAGFVPVGTVVEDQIGTVLKKINKDQWIEVYTYDEDAPDYSYDAEVTPFAPLKGVKLKGS